MEIGVGSFSSVANAATVPAALWVFALEILLTPDMLLQTTVFLGISVGILCALEKSDACQSNSLRLRCEFLYNNVCFDFVGELNTWTKARSSCERRGGLLLNNMSSPMKTFLRNITSERSTGNFTWWLGGDGQGDGPQPAISEWQLSAELCVYLLPS